MTDPLPTDGLPPASARQGGPGHDQALDRSNAIRLLTMRTAGLTYEQMAQEAGYADASGARQALLRALDRHESESAASLRKLENLRLDADERVLRGIVGNGGLTASERIRAVDARTRLAARRARLNGLDAPVQIAVSSGALAELDDALELLESVVRGEVTESHDLGPEPEPEPDSSETGAADQHRATGPGGSPSQG